jgi:hypothetical protein
MVASITSPTTKPDRNMKKAQLAKITAREPLRSLRASLRSARRAISTATTGGLSDSARFRLAMCNQFGPALGTEITPNRTARQANHLFQHAASLAPDVKRVVQRFFLFWRHGCSAARNSPKCKGKSPRCLRKCRFSASKNFWALMR